MPYYEYKCSNECGRLVELKMGIKECHPEHVMKPCPSDPSGHTFCEHKRALSKTSFSLAGGSWAKDGYSG